MKKFLFISIFFASIAGTSHAEAYSMKDFLIQDVCLDRYGKVLPVAPAGNKCFMTRNLKIGEKLPYHKHDHQGTDTNPEAAKGYQRSDRFPSADGTSLVKTFDFGVGGGTFGIKDSNDGFDVHETRGAFASIIATQDATGGVQFFLGPKCKPNAKNFFDINDTWLIGPNTFKLGQSGTLQAYLKDENKINTCPSTHYNQSLTNWESTKNKFTYTSGVALISLISSHYSHPTTAESDHIEKFYFTNELGVTRWERWERPGTPYHTNEAERSETLTASKRCNGSTQMEDATGTWYMVDCRDWTNIQPSTNKGGDAPLDWSQDALAHENSSALNTATTKNLLSNASNSSDTVTGLQTKLITLLTQLLEGKK